MPHVYFTLILADILTISQNNLIYEGTKVQRLKKMKGKGFRQRFLTGKVGKK